jgi:hypothetical protein
LGEKNLAQARLIPSIQKLILPATQTVKKIGTLTKHASLNRGAFRPV